MVTITRRRSDSWSGRFPVGAILGLRGRPFVVGSITVNRLDPQGVLLGLGLLAAATGLYFRTPMLGKELPRWPGH